jgi:hypothetical protein
MRKTPRRKRKPKEPFLKCHLPIKTKKALILQVINKETPGIIRPRQFSHSENNLRQMIHNKYHKRALFPGKRDTFPRIR